MMYGRPAVFWFVTVLVFCSLLWMLSEALLPFVAGLALAWLQAPLADRRERLGMNRTGRYLENSIYTAGQPT